MRKSAHSILRPILSAILILPFIMAIPSCAKDQDSTSEQRAAFQAINAIEDLNARLEAVEEFIQKWPESRNFISCLQVGLRTAAEIDPESDLVIEYAERYIEAYTSRGEALAYSNAADMLNEAGARSDKVDEYIGKALAGAEEIENIRSRATIYVTAATISAARDATEEAIDFQQQAMELNPGIRNAGVTLAGYLMKAGRLDEAEGHLIDALLQAPDNTSASEQFDDLVAQRTNNRNMETYRARVIGEGADRLLAASEDQLQAKLTLTVSFAKLGVLIDRAQRYADEISGSIGPEDGGDAFLAAISAIGQVRLATGDHQGVLNALEPARMLAGPYDDDFHLARGMALEALGRDREAIEEYFEVAAMRNSQPIMARLEPLWARVNPGRSLEDHQTTLREGLESWHPEGEFVVPTDWTGKVVLAELFTGSECPPCVASDLAYDGLIAYYPRSVAAVLVHHVHIPGPDPMTNPDTEDRMAYYGRDVIGGTPTSIFDGTDSSVGGGGAAAGKGKFGTYGWTLEQHLTETPMLEINVAGNITGDELEMAASVTSDDPGLTGNENLRLRVVLAEGLLHFTGANGVAEHQMVVRAFIGGHEGYALGQDNRTTNVEDSINLATLQSDLLSYLTTWESENPDRFRNSPGFSKKMHEIDRSQLLLVAFVQNDETKEVYQTRVIELR
ncbi:hypothetical protein ACFL3H_04730 [Gemmatimonadota bacterium]